MINSLANRLAEIINEQDFCFSPLEMRTVEKSLSQLQAYERTGLDPNEIKSLQREYEVLKQKVDILRAQSIVDTVPVVHGEWELAHEFMPIYMCSVCKQNGTFNDHGNYAFSNYCPNCGAKMDEGAK